MNSDKEKQRIAQLLVDTGAYRDLDKPVILTSGQLGIFYVNSENLLGDPKINEKLKEFEHDSRGMIDYAVDRVSEDHNVSEVVEIMANEVQGIAKKRGYERFAISGGQRRDWVFSGPIARILGKDHISLFKSGRADVVTVENFYSPWGVTCLGSEVYDGVIHVADLLTEGSSCYRLEDGVEKGWIPMLRERGANICDLVAVVTRLQGGEENMRAREVEPYTFVAIDKNFLNSHSSDPARAISYVNDPDAWSRQYLTENGAMAFVDAFNPEGGKHSRAMKFAKRYNETLRDVGRWQELREDVKGKFNYDLEAVLE